MRITIQSIILVALLGAPSIVHSQGLVPESINYQGVLVDALGNPLPDGNYEINFTIYNQATLGTAVWGPIEFDGGSTNGHRPQVPVVDGKYNVTLGPEDTSGRSIVTAFNGTTGENDLRFLEIAIEGTTLAPRQQLTSTPFAYSAQGMVPIGSILAHHTNMPGAASIAALKEMGFALCNGTTAASQGITDAVITGILPDLNVGDGTGRFLRGSTGTTGVLQEDQIQGHHHSASNHTHAVTAANHGHSITQFNHSHDITTRRGDTGDRTATEDGETGGGTHTAYTNYANLNITSISNQTISVSIQNQAVAVGDPTQGAHGAARVGTETRPKSMTVAWIIRVR
ncbi:MAG: hypothetical protein H6752_05065 [Candidatus Omnitrophica bacterium]|nr:hypothetical protein [Candidatus Omnitrophota bacterium]